MASIVLLQNDPLVAEGLRRAIDAEAGLQVCGLAGSLAQARRQLEHGSVDLLLADLRIGGERLVELLRERRASARVVRPQVLVIAMSPEDPHLMQALRQGADGYFIHGYPMSALVRVIHQVLAGESPMSPPIARRLQAHFKHAPSLAASTSPGLPRSPDLTDTERQMLDRVSQGYLAHEIARELQTSEHGVGLRSRSLLRKLQHGVRAAALVRPAA
jgi:DNA-binding NarL/FixJ family response regulator